MVVAVTTVLIVKIKARSQNLKMSSLFDIDLSDSELLLQLATFAALQNNDIAMYKNIVLARIGQDVWQRLSKKEQEIEALRCRTIISIADFVKKHPKTKENELAAVIQKHIDQFKVDLEPLI